MAPSIIPGDRIFVDKTAFGLHLPFANAPLLQWREPQRFDIIVFKAPQTRVLTVKRVIGMPGDRVSWRDGQLSINSQAARYVEQFDDKALQNRSRAFAHTQQLTEEIMEGEHSILRFTRPSQRSGSDFEDALVPANHYLLLGDNRDNSGDYRKFGFVSRDSIVGRAQGVLFSLDPDQYYLPRWRRGISALR